MDLLRIGQKLSIFFQKGQNMVEMSCSIVGIYDDRLDIELPQYFMRYIEYLQEGLPLTIKVFSKIGTIDFNTIIISSPMEDKFSVELDYNAMKLTANEEIPVVGAMENLDIKYDDSYIRVKTFEISTEYVKFYCDKPFKLDESYDCILCLPKEYGTISFRAVITDVDEVYENEYTAAYYNMTEDSRQTLLYYMYIYSSDLD